MVKSLADAKACIDQRTSQAGQGGRGGATRRSRRCPNHGLAHYCLALIAQDKKAPRAEVVKHLQASAKGDPLSLPVWTALATQYQQANDTANTLRGVQADAPRRADQPEAARGAVQVLPPVAVTRRPRSRWPTRASRSTRTTPTCTTSRATPACSSATSSAPWTPWRRCTPPTPPRRTRSSSPRSRAAAAEGEKPDTRQAAQVGPDRGAEVSRTTRPCWAI